jgi:hypothetical protein
MKISKEFLIFPPSFGIGYVDTRRSVVDTNDNYYQTGVFSIFTRRMRRTIEFEPILIEIFRFGA